jgi:hypothetical protein
VICLDPSDVSSTSLAVSFFFIVQCRISYICRRERGYSMFLLLRGGDVSNLIYLSRKGRDIVYLNFVNPIVFEIE